MTLPGLLPRVCWQSLVCVSLTQLISQVSAHAESWETVGLFVFLELVHGLHLCLSPLSYYCLQKEHIILYCRLSSDPFALQKEFVLFTGIIYSFIH